MWAYMSDITTIRVTKKIHAELKRFAESRGLTLGAAVGVLLREHEIAVRLDRIEELMREQNILLKEILKALKGGVIRLADACEEEMPAAILDESVPSFVRGNPWVEVLKKRGTR